MIWNTVIICGIKEKIANSSALNSNYKMSDNLLFAWTYRVGKREFLVEIFREGTCLFYDESIRQFLSRAGKTPQAFLIEEIEADDPSPARARKTEFAIRLKIDSEHLNLIRNAREEFDEKDDVSAELEGQINSRFGPIFSSEVKPFLAIPLADL